MLDYFPSKLALGEQFCNRKNEINSLKKNISQCRHTVLIAPRRYGKSSLVANVVKQLDDPFSSVDLFLAHDDIAITKRILTGIAQAVSQILPLEHKILLKLQNIFSKFRVSLGAKGFNIDLSMESSGFDAVDQILNGLQSLAILAKEKHKKVIFFIDEFQDIKEAKSAKSIQGSIRHVAQETAEIMFIFSGSNKRLLLELFDNKSMPLYMLCDMMPLDRISSEHYWPHLQKFAKKKWREELSREQFERIMVLTELHPYYVNLLCHEIWKNDSIPSLNKINNCWQICYEMHEDRIFSDLEKLTPKQQDVLKALALHPVTEPSGHNFVKATNMPTSSIMQTIKALLAKDMIYKVKKTDTSLPQISLNQIRILDPLLAFALRKYA